jgi:hypothetical protein
MAKNSTLQSNNINVAYALASTFKLGQVLLIKIWTSFMNCNYFSPYISFVYAQAPYFILSRLGHVGLIFTWEYELA